MLPWILTAAFAVGMLFMIIRNRLLKSDLCNLMEQIEKKLNSDTNVLLYVSGRDKQLCTMTAKLNKQLDLLRKQQLQYQHGNTELKTAVTNISHDLRTPLTAIAGNLYMIQKTDDLAEIREYISAIEERTETMKQLTEELFRYSVIVSSEDETVTEEVFVNQVLAESISSFYPVLTEKGITPQIHITDARIVRNISKSDLTRVFSNLLNNAVKYSDGDLNVSLSDTGEITFTNTAKELSTVEVEQLFDRFYTVEAAHHSTGLGLSIARTLVERMGGTITADYENSRLKIIIIL